jgi:hypothetical protein
LLPLSLVPARERRVVRFECDDAGPVIRFVRVGTLDSPDHLPPDIHIFTASKQPWVALTQGVPAVPEYYDRESHWPPESLTRRLEILPRIEAYQASLVRDRR